MTDFSALGFEGTAPVQLAKLAQTQGQASLLQAQAQATQMKNQQAKVLQGLLQQAASGMGVSRERVPGITGQNDVPRMLREFGALATQAGDMKTAGEMLVKSEQAAAHEANTRQSLAAEEKTLQATQWDRLVKLEQILASAKDQNSFDAANGTYTALFKRQSPYAGRRYDEVRPQLEALTQQVLTAKETIQLNREQGDANVREANAQDLIQNRKIRAKIAQDKLTFLKQEKIRERKLGGKGVKTPSAEQVEQVRAYVTAAMPDLEPKDTYQKSVAVAGMALQLQTEHPGLRRDWDAAIRQALPKVSRDPGLTFQDGVTPSTALPLPENRKLEVGKYYTTGKGVGKFTGQGIQLLPTGIDEEALSEEE